MEEAQADLDHQEPNVAAADSPRVLMECAALALQERSPPQVQINRNPPFGGQSPLVAQEEIKSALGLRGLTFPAGLL